jgi:hypothetical protein
MMVATWKTNLYRNADAQKVADEIISIGDSATPAEILDKARGTDTELHKCFEWNDTAAAEKYRLHQARNIVCNLVFVEREAEQPKEVRVFYKIEPGHDAGYQQTVKIVQNQDKYKRLLSVAFGELKAFQRKYQMLGELEPIFCEIEKLAV